MGARRAVGGRLRVAGVLDVVSLGAVGLGDKAGAITVVMKGTRFEPVELTIPAGQQATLAVTNDDLGVHTFIIEALGIDEVIIGGSEKLITIPAASPGSFAYVCEIFGHEAMTGTLVVQAAAQ